MLHAPSVHPQPGLQVSQVQVSGSALVSVKPFIDAELGPAAWRRFLDRGTPLVVETFSRPILPLSWYPLLAVVQGMDALVEAAQDPVVLRSYARFNLDFGTKMIFRAIFKLGSPEFMIARSDQVWRKYYSAGRVICEAKGGRARMQVHDFPPVNHNFDRVVMHSAEAVLLKAGAREVTATHTRCNRVGSPFCEYIFNWK